jgi:Leucine-rich repeat (LRR) protein
VVIINKALNSIISDNTNQIISFECEKLKKISYNTSHINTIEFGCFEIFNRLEILDLSENGLTEIKQYDFNFLENLKHLNLSNNSIKTIHSDSFLSLKNLEYLSLGFNLIEKIEPASHFKSLTSLKHLDLRSRNNYEINFVNQSSSNCFSKLETLECSFKCFYDNFDSFRTLNYLKITDTDDHYIGSEISPSPVLKRISIEINEIKNNTQDFLKKATGLEEIQLKVNSDKATNFFVFDNLKSLRVHAAKINFSNIKNDLVYKNLNEFSYRNSFLMPSEFTFDFRKVPNIKCLCLENAKFEKSLETLQYLTFLQSLLFKNIEIRNFKLFCKTLTALPHLSVISLKNCNLNEQKFILNFNNNHELKTQLKELHLDMNKFSNINSISASFNKIEILSMR